MAEKRSERVCEEVRQTPSGSEARKVSAEAMPGGSSGEVRLIERGSRCGEGGRKDKEQK